MIDGADKLLMAHAHRQIALANDRIAALEAEVASLRSAQQSKVTPRCWDCGGVPDSSGKVVHVDGCQGD